MPYSQALPPFLQGLLAAQQQGNQEQQLGLQSAQTAIGMQSALQKQQQEAAYRNALGGLPADATPEQTLNAIRPHASADVLARTIQSSQDRQAQIAAVAEQKKATLEQAKQQAEMLHEFRMGKLQDDQSKRLETERHNRVIEGISAQNSALNNQLRLMGLQIQQQGLEIKKGEAERKATEEGSKKTAALQKALETANLPEADAVLKAVETTLSTKPEIAEYISGPKSLLPDVALPNDITAGRQAFQKLFNITLKNRSGAAVTIPEFERLKSEFATGVFKSPAQLKEGVDQARNIINKHYQSVAAGFGQDALEQYNKNLTEFGGTPILSGGGAQAAPKTRIRFDAQGNPIQ